jgi:hypothetical protein
MMILGMKEQTSNANTTGQIQKFEEVVQLGSLKEHHVCTIAFEDVNLAKQSSKLCQTIAYASSRGFQFIQFTVKPMNNSLLEMSFFKSRAMILMQPQLTVLPP